MEDAALDALKKISLMEGVTKLVGLPDLHPGKTPVGAVVLTDGIIFPHLVGNDVGCGMSLFQSATALKKIKLERLAPRFESLESLSDIELSFNPYPEDSIDPAFGTLGGSNHFLELQAVDRVYLPTEFKELEIDKAKLLLLVHSGSRSKGQMLYESYMEHLSGISMSSGLGETYLKEQKELLLWAQRNRECLARRAQEFLDGRSELRLILDNPHNFVEEGEGGFYHRKGAVNALNGPVIIPGSRGTLTYVMKPTSDCQKSLFSLAHGAGRKWKRSDCKGRLRDKYRRDELYTTALKSRVICHDKELLYEEAPEAYKKVTDVIGALVDSGLASLICTTRPLLTLKI
jgi:release factor H-coupled RctB family protein